MNTDYTTVINHPRTYQGDTLNGLAITLSIKDVKITPKNIDAKIMTRSGRVIHRYDHEMDDERVMIPALHGDVTKNFPAEVLKYSVTLEIPEYGNYTLVAGSIPMVKGNNKC